MNDNSLPQLRISAVVECPWCDAWTELADDAPVARCEACGTETEVADRPARTHAIAA